jgi:hypothetical protein
MMLSVRDEYRHSPGEGQWNESYWFNMFDPRQSIGVMSRIGLLPNQNRSNYWVFVTKGDKIIHRSINFDIPYSNHDVTNLDVGELKFYLLEPLRKFRIICIAKEKIVDLVWSNTTPIFDFSEIKALPESIASNHYQQIGQVSGLIQFKDEFIDFSGYGVRDHSWGQRDWSPIDSWEMVEGNFVRDFAFSALSMKFKNGKTTRGGFLFSRSQISLIHDYQFIGEVKGGKTSQEPVRILLRGAADELYTVWGSTVCCCALDMGNLMDLEFFTAIRMGDLEGSGMLSIGYQK